MQPSLPSKLLIISIVVGVILPTPFVRAQSNTSEITTPKDLFATSVAPILVSRCMACHNEEKSEGGYSVSNLAKLFVGGDSKQSAITAGNLEKSELWQRLIATDKSIRMPSEGEPLTPNELKAIQSWIVDGAKFSDVHRDKSLSEIAVSRTVRAPVTYPRPIGIHAIRIGAQPDDVFVSGYAEVTRWNGSTQSLVQRIDVAGEHIGAFDLSADGKWIAVSSGTPGLSGIVEIINLENDSGKRIALEKTIDVSPSVAFSPDSRRLAVARFDGTLQVVSIDQASHVVRSKIAMAPHADSILSVIWSGDSKRLMTASRDRTAKLFDATKMELLVSYDRHERAVGGVGFFKTRPLTLDETGRLRVMQGEDDDRVVSDQAGLPRVLQEFASNQDGVFVADKQRIRSFVIESTIVDDGKDKDDKPKTKQVTRLKEGTSFDANPGTDLISVTATGKVVAAGSQQGEVWLWNKETREVILHFRAKP